jgi:hypothetical protein
MFGFEECEWFLAGASMAVPMKGREVKAIEFELPYIVTPEKPNNLPKTDTLEVILGYNNNQETFQNRLLIGRNRC